MTLSFGKRFSFHKLQMLRAYASADTVNDSGPNEIGTFAAVVEQFLREWLTSCLLVSVKYCCYRTVALISKCSFLVKNAIHVV